MSEVRVTALLGFSSLIQMSNVEPEIDDDHPLALELSSLRTAVARFQVRILLVLQHIVHAT